MACAMLLFQDPHHCTRKLLSIGSQHGELRGSPLRNPFAALPLSQSLASPPSAAWKGQTVTCPQQHPLSLSTSILLIFCEPGAQRSGPQSQRPKTWLRQEFHYGSHDGSSGWTHHAKKGC